MSREDDSTRPGGRPPAHREEPAPPARVGAYEVLGELGRGGFGVVLRARQGSLGRDVALKMIRRSGPASAIERERFRVEAQAVAALRHPGIVTIHEIGEHEGAPWFSMELVEGPSLSRHVAARGPLPEGEAARLTLAIARAVEHAHERGIIHRDLKPANVLLAADGAPKLADFGLAARAGAATGDDPLTVVGTPAWMAPEQAEGRHDLMGPATDVHALGALLYFMLSGAAPFEADTEAELLLQVATRPPVALRRLRRGVSRELEAMCTKCLEKDPAARYATARDVAADLERFLADEPVRARERSPGAAVRRWFIQRPALSVTWCALAVLYVAEIGLLRWLPDPDQARFHEQVTHLAVGWAAAAGLLQAWLLRTRRPSTVLAAWTLTEAALFATLVALGDGPRSATITLQPVLVFVSVFRLRPWIVVLATAAALAGWAGVCVEAAVLRPELTADGQQVVVHAIALLLAGAITWLAVRRLRALHGLRAAAAGWAHRA